MEDVFGRSLDRHDAAALLQQRAGGTRQRSQELLFRRFQSRLERRGLEAPHHRQRHQQRGRLGPRQPDRRLEIAFRQPVASLRSALRLDRHAQAQQAIDVAIDGPERYLEAPGEFRGRHRPTAGQRQQQAQGSLDRVHGRAGKYSLERGFNADMQLSGLIAHIPGHRKQEKSP